MDTFDAIYGRRAVKHFDPDYVIPADDERKLFEAAIQAPTSFNIQHWRIGVSKDPERGKEGPGAGKDQAQESDASAAVASRCRGRKATGRSPKAGRASGAKLSAA